MILFFFKLFDCDDTDSLGKKLGSLRVLSHRILTEIK